MRFPVPTVLWILALGACSSAPDTQTFSVYFVPFSDALEQQARTTVADAARFAKSNQTLPIAVTGYSAPINPKRDEDRLSARRADAVKEALITNGIAPERISTVANGTTDPTPLPNLAVRRVDIDIGQINEKDEAVAGGFK